MKYSKMISYLINLLNKMDIAGIILGTCISIGSVGTYIPQFYNIIKYKSVEGISEASLIILNIGMMCLTMNSLIYSWNYFFCNCFYYLLPFITILISWLTVSIYYIIFLLYKHKKLKKIFEPTLSYSITYLFFITLVIGLALVEKIEKNPSFFFPYADVLGITSAIANGIVYIPQIYTLMKNRSNGNLSLLMYILQTPGNIIIIVFQAIVFKLPLTTWLTYFIVLIEQAVILILMLIFRNNDKNVEVNIVDVEFYD